MSVRTDVVNLQININGNKAQNDLNNLRKKAMDLSSELKGMAKGTAEFTQKSADLKKVEADMAVLRKELGLGALTMSELNKESRQLNAILKNIAPGTKEFKEYADQLTKVNARQRELKQGMQGFSTAQREVTGGSEGFGKILGRVGEYFAAYSIIERTGEIVKDFFVSTIEEANTAEQALSNLHNTLENAGRLDLFETLNEEAERFANTYKALDDDDVKNVFSKLIDYGKLTKSQITQLTDVIINYAAKQKISLGDSTDVFTKALEGNAKGLKTYGINIKDAANFGERLNLVLGPMAEKVKNAETAFESTNQGALARMKEGFNKVKETIGLFLLSLTGLSEKQHENAVVAKQQADQGNALIAQYEQLAQKTNLTTAEKKKLKSIEVDLVGIFGESILEIDKQTGAYKLNIEATKSLIKQKLLLANNDAAGIAAKIAKAQDDQAEATRKLAYYTDALTEAENRYGMTAKDAAKKYRVKFTEPTAAEKNTPVYKIVALNEQLTINRDKIGEASGALKTYEKQLNELGFTMKDVSKLFTPATVDTVVGSGDPGGDGAAQLKKQRADEYAQLIKQAQEFHKKLVDLDYQASLANKSEDEKELEAARHKFSELLKEYDSFAKKLHGKDISIIGPRENIEKAAQVEIDALIQKQRKASFEKEQKEIRDNLVKAYNEQVQLTDLKYEKEKEAQQKRFTAGEIDKKNYEAAIAHIDVLAKEEQLHNAEQFALQTVTIEGKVVPAVDKAVSDVTKLKKEALEKQVADAIKAYELIEANRKYFEDLQTRSAIAKVDTRIIIASSRGDIGAQLAAEKDKLQLSRKAKLKALDDEKKDALSKLTEEGDARTEKEREITDDINNMKEEADAEYYENLNKLEEEAAAKRREHARIVADMTIEIFSNLNQILSNIENRRFAAEVARNEKSKKLLKSQLDNKLISQAQYDKKMALLEEGQERRQKELQRKQAKREKAITLFSTIISTAQAVAGALGSKPIGPWNIALAALFGALGAAQIGVVASSPLPELAKGQWFTKGDKHSDPSGGIPVMIERDEAVITAAAMTDKRRYTVTGTPAQITSQLNGQAGGVSWAPGAFIGVAKWLNEPPSRISADIPRIMAQGGYQGIPSVVAASDQSSQILREILEEQRLNRQELANMKTRLHAVVSIKEYREEEKRYDDARKASGFNQNP